MTGARMMIALGAALLLLPTASMMHAQREVSLQPAAPAGWPRWVASWTAALEAPYGSETLPAGALKGMTLRETVHLSLGGNRLQVRLSNLFGEASLVLRNVTVAVPTSARPDGSIVPASWKPVLFGGQPGVTIAPGQEVAGDPLNYNVRPGADLVISLDVTSAPDKQTLHAGARATEFLLAGDHADEASLPGATTNTRWYFLSGVDVEERTAAPVVVAFGDSITDGHGATTDGNDRWTDDLFRRLQAASPTNSVAVVNEGIGGNCVLQVCVGPPATERFQRDVLDVPGAKTVIVLEGINDLGALSRKEPQAAAVHAALVQQMEAAFTKFVADAHAHGIRALGGTLTPWMGSEYYHPDAQAEADRMALNTWIRTSGTFDGVIDFDAAVRDPQRPDHMLPAYDSGDHLHPGPAGYQKMADALNLNLLTGTEPGDIRR
ncbi:SGNH/GDSL hydrolase family protein [Terriglobus aquaticus]|uniref:SGNH/GDSL hydrolase family protein n=1 Tax=Terriglobus aquaticus TaxID=940139 RepID=A0ABW9KHQ3_9BACT|nr:SGNH/GDSL hydrolase family protein [Terriglobus aquaticus]